MKKNMDKFLTKLNSPKVSKSPAGARNKNNKKEKDIEEIEVVEEVSNKSKSVEVDDHECEMEVDDDKKQMTPDKSDEQDLQLKECKVVIEMLKDPSTPVASNLKLAKTTSHSSLKKKRTEAEKQQAAQQRMEAAKKKEEEEQKKKEARLKLEEERRKRKAEEEERKAERLKLEEERRKRKAEEEERKAENRRKMEELRKKREEEKIKREEEKIKQMEEKLEKEKELERQRQEKLEKERIKNEEKRLKEEEKAREEEEKRRKADMVKNKFAQFFTKVDVPKPVETDQDKQKYRFMSFELKENMTQAPISRRPDITNCEEFSRTMDEELCGFHQLSEDKRPNYLKEIRANPKLIRRQKTNSRKSKKQKVIKINEDSNIGHDDENSVQEIKSSLEPVHEAAELKTRVKYLHFDKTVYRRPPYYGTWRKRSKVIRPRNPFGMDEKLIDYEIDSDEEWEDCADAESIGDSDKDEEEERMNAVDDDEDDGFLVPHGHLSDDELEEDERMMNPEERKLREAAKTEQWETERKKATKYLIPKCYFAVDYWNERDASLHTAKDSKHLKHLERLKMMPFLKDFSASLFPVHIITDEQLEREKREKQASDEAAKKAKAAAKEALKEEANASPTTTTPKSKLKKKNSDNGQNNSSPLVQSATNTPVAPSSNSILKFVSKMNSNKNIICKVDKPNSQARGELEQEVCEVIAAKPPISNNKNVNSPISNQKINTNTPNNKPKLSKNQSTSLLGSNALPTTPVSSPLVHNNTTAEKRANDFSGENMVKRMKLDEINSGSNEKNTPSVKALFKNSPVRKNLQLNNGNQQANSISPVVKKHVLGPAKRHSIDGVIEKLIASRDTTSSRSNDGMEVEPGEVVPANNKENDCVTLD